MSFVGHLLFNNTYTPPTEAGVRKHRIMKDPSQSGPKEPVQARTKIMKILDKLNWKSVSEIADETAIPKNTVFQTAERLYKAGKIETRKKPTIYGDIKMYRKK